MIYQHRLVLSRNGKIDQRHSAFQGATLAALDAHGSLLIGAWEVWIGADAGSATWQLRQFDSLAAWEQHQERVRHDQAHDQRRQSQLYPHVDFVDTHILRLAAGSPALPQDWPLPGSSAPNSVYLQRIIAMTPSQAPMHHEFYFSEVLPALEREGSRVLALFDTVIGPGTTNGGSHRSVELRRFDDLASLQRWREAQDEDPGLRRPVRGEWASRIPQTESTPLRPSA